MDRKVLASDAAQDVEPSASVREESTSYLQSSVAQTEYAGIRSHQFAVSDGIVAVPAGLQVPPVPPAALVRIQSRTDTLSSFIRLSLAKNVKYSPFSITQAEESTNRKGREYVQQKSDSAYFSKPTSQADTAALIIESGNSDEYEKIYQCQEDLQVQKESVCQTEEPSNVGISTPTTSTAEPLNTKERIGVGPGHVTSLSDPTVKHVQFSSVPVSWHDTGQPNTAPSSATPGSDTSTATVTPRELLEPSTLKDRQTNGSPLFPPLAPPSKKLTKQTQGSDTSAATRKRKSYNLPSPGEPDPENSEYEEARQETPWERTDLVLECDSQDETREKDRIYHGYKVKFFTEYTENDPFRNSSQLLSPVETPSETHFIPQSFTCVHTILSSQVSHFVSIPPPKDQPFRFRSEGLSTDLDSGYASNKPLPPGD